MPINFIQRGQFFDTLSGRTNEWTLGTGSVDVFTQNGDAAENQRVWSTNPWGQPAIVWETHPDAVRGADGGWVTDYFPIDNTKLYRFSVWARTTSTNAGTDDGRFYLGCRSKPTHVEDMDNCVTNTNPYWWGGSYLYTNFTQYEWYLFVGHVWPSTAKCQYGIDTHINSGKYSIASGYIQAPTAGHDFRFNPETTSITHRCYHFYATDTNARLQFFDPRIELCDGSEGTIESLLDGGGTYSGKTLGPISVTRTGGSFYNQNVDATGGNEITEVGHWRIHKFTSSGNFVVNSFVGSALEVDYLIVGGGGGAGSGDGGNPPGGGGAGGVLSGYCYLDADTYAITVGSGGLAGSFGDGGNNGTDSTFNGLTAVGGGGGGGDLDNNGQGGGSGGGGCYTGIGGSGYAGQGNDGGDGNTLGGAGGGFSSVGQDGLVSNAGGGGGQRGGIEGQPILYGGGGYGTDDGGTSNTPTGTDPNWNYLGYYGFGGNAPSNAASSSDYDGNDGIVIIRYKFR